MCLLAHLASRKVWNSHPPWQGANTVEELCEELVTLATCPRSERARAAAPDAQPHTILCILNAQIFHDALDMLCSR